MDLMGMLAEPARRAGLEARSLAVMVRAGLVGLETPDRLLGIISALNDYGPLGAAPRIAALRHGDYPAIADERGELTFRELDEQVNRLCDALAARGLDADSSLGVLCRNHRYPLIAGFAASRLGMKGIWLNTAFSARQAKEVSEREGVDLLIYDESLAEAAAGVDADHGKIVTATEDPAADELEQLIASGDPAPPPAPGSPGKLVLLTSGTTGTPKGAPRAEPRGFTFPGAMLERMPMRARETTVIGPPLYHGTGLSMALLSIGLGSKLVLRSKFDAARFLDDSAAHSATTWCA
ncbi:MAG: AMP-binding protein, partial [Actinomycetia bacterium]|nr:AMP-binding protein [Actinomycetes bacterium]